MKKEFVPYDIALAMKELGFDEDCFGFYSLHDDNKAVGGNYPCNGTNSAPLYQQSFRWFREEYGYNTQISEVLKWCYVFIIEKWEDKRFVSDNYSKVNEAQSACLRKLIKIVKDENKER